MACHVQYHVIFKWKFHIFCLSFSLQQAWISLILVSIQLKLHVMERFTETRHTGPRLGPEDHQDHHQSTQTSSVQTTVHRRENVIMVRVKNRQAVTTMVKICRFYCCLKYMGGSYRRKLCCFFQLLQKIIADISRSYGPLTFEIKHGNSTHQHNIQYNIHLLHHMIYNGVDPCILKQF